MKRTPLYRKTPLRRSGRMPRGKPPKRSKRDRAWDDARQMRLDIDQHTCQAHWRHECWGGLHVHHIKRRSQGGTDEMFNLVTLCLVAHEHVHANPAWSREHGYLR